MQAMNETDIKSIVEQVVLQLKSRGAIGVNGSSSRTGALGIHNTVSDAVAAAKDAFEAFSKKSIGDRKRATDCIRKICISQCKELGEAELAETKIGRLDHKIEKLVVAGEKSPGVETCGPTPRPVTMGDTQ